MSKNKFLFSLIVIPLLASALAANTMAKEPAGIIHDAEYYVLEAQHGEKWAKEDKELDQKLAELKKSMADRRISSISCGTIRPMVTSAFPPSRRSEASIHLV